jgi:hypothetical protein
LYYKTFYGRNLRIFILSKSVFPGQPFQPSLMFAGKAGAYPSEAPLKLAKDKHSILLRKSVNYGRKKFYSTGPRTEQTEFFSCLPFGIGVVKLFTVVNHAPIR